MLLSLILALGIVWMSARTKVIPFVVEVDKLGYAITIPTALSASNTPASGLAASFTREEAWSRRRTRETTDRAAGPLTRVT